MTHTRIGGFGLIIIGSEILDGRYQDQHAAACRNLLAERNLLLSYSLTLPDRPTMLTQQLSWAMSQSVPFFCCGGIGSTPDDLTRPCASEAAGVPLEMHPEGSRILKQRFGERATPSRMEMARFPRGASLIPNPVNQVSGFSIRNGYFLPGFPEMSHPMMVWILDQYRTPNEPIQAFAIFLKGHAEADLVDEMESFMRDHPSVYFSSLPHMTSDGGELELGIRGSGNAFDSAKNDLLTRFSDTE